MRKDAACLAALGAALLFAPAAHAGVYNVASCAAPGGDNVNLSWTLEPYNSQGAAAPALSHFSVPSNVASCPAPATDLTAYAAPAADAVKSGDGVAFVFRAPAGNTVTNVAISRFMESRQSSPPTASPFWLAVARAGTTVGGPVYVAQQAGGEVCDGSSAPANGYCTRGTPNTLNPAASFPVTSQPVVQWGIECAGGANCATGSAGTTNAVIQFQGATVTVADSTPPVMDAGNPADGWHRPSDSLTAHGSDGGGLTGMRALVDGTEVASQSFTCDYHLPSPCPTSPTMPIPLSGLSDGTHSVTVTGVDVGSNGGRGDRALNIDGTPPTVSLVPTKGGRTIKFAVADALSGVKSGQISIRASIGAPFIALPTTLRKGQLQATVPKRHTPSDYGISVAATDNAGNATGGQATTMSLNTRRGKHLVKVRNASARVSYGHSVVISGRLTTVDGVKLGGQQLLVTGTVRQSGATPQLLTSVTTGPTGRFSFTVPAGPSRKLDITFGGAPSLLTRTRSVALHVPAHSTIHASDTTVFGAATVRFSGRLGLLGAHLPSGGKIVVLEAEQHGHWSTVATTRARGSRSTWHAVAHFRGNPGIFPVRLRIPREGVFPYDLGHSPAVKIRVF